MRLTKLRNRSSSLLMKIVYGKLFSASIFKVKTFHSKVGCFLAILVRSVQLQHSSGGLSKPEVPEDTSDAGSPALGVRC